MPYSYTANLIAIKVVNVVVAYMCRFHTIVAGVRVVAVHAGMIIRQKHGLKALVVPV